MEEENWARNKEVPNLAVALAHRPPESQLPETADELPKKPYTTSIIHLLLVGGYNNNQHNMLVL